MRVGGGAADAAAQRLNGRLDVGRVRRRGAGVGAGGCGDAARAAGCVGGWRSDRLVVRWGEGRRESVGLATGGERRKGALECRFGWGLATARPRSAGIHS